MARYKCSVCGYIFEETESKKFEDLKQCPVCKQSASVFERIEEETEAQAPEDIGEENSLIIRQNVCAVIPPAAIWQRSTGWQSQVNRSLRPWAHR